ncbi:pilus assembly protein TadG-related protein [Lignipirellula cremea]|uniref:Putative Flp pilus-assembly TadG-like N-terminal domain-containing protein n=1 Tax=Lignipirellula cremea TaxID=2528010 RepID=A0A518E579_9BACT|nr:pilus assembly protein TadG-related protein [Lignipirellula cremea]QDU99218.1 hypothetical protein Pla8534_71310 [Lignipirellula cremea]
MRNSLRFPQLGPFSPRRTRSIRQARRQQRGIASIWTLLLVPVIAIGLVLVVEIANLWIARAELENAMEAAALAAVKEWGDNIGGSTATPRTVGKDYAALNTVRKVPVVISDVRDDSNPVGNPNENVSYTEDLLFGAITSTPVDAPNHVFNASVAPNCGVGQPYAVRAKKRVKANSVCANLFGVNLNGFFVQAEAVAVYDCVSKRTQLIRIATYAGIP